MIRLNRTPMSGLCIAAQRVITRELVCVSEHLQGGRLQIAFCTYRGLCEWKEGKFSRE